MDINWQSEFRARMMRFGSAARPGAGESAISIKVRVVGGCFHREHSPHAYALIDRHLASLNPEKQKFAFVEHESGPELLAYILLATAGLNLATSIIDMIVVIIKARQEGIKFGDRPSEPLELIVRRLGEGDKYIEEIVLRMGHEDKVTRANIEVQIKKALKNLRPRNPSGNIKPSKIKSRRKKRHS